MSEVEVGPVLRTPEGVDASDGGRAAGDIAWGCVDVLELAKNAFAKHRSEFNKVLSGALVRSCVTPDARAFVRTSLSSNRTRAPRDETLEALSLQRSRLAHTVLAHRSEHLALD